jgi:hypothetical protein
MAANAARSPLSFSFAFGCSHRYFGFEPDLRNPCGSGFNPTKPGSLFLPVLKKPLLYKH